MKKMVSGLGIIFMILLSACPNPTSMNEGSLKIVLPAAGNRRTIIPEIAPSVSEYVISYSDGPEEFVPVHTSDTEVTLSLLSGSWDIEVLALDEIGNTIAGDLLEEIDISSGSLKTVTASLEGVQNAAGGIDVTVTWPGSVAIETMKVLFDGVEVDVSYITSTDTSVTFANSSIASANNHKLEVSLTPEGSSPPIKIIDIVHIYDYLTTSHTYELTESDFYGGVSIIIEVDEPSAQEIVFSEEEGFTVDQGDTLSLSINDDFDAYEWYMDGNAVSGQATASFTYDTSGLTLGTHRITVIGTLGDSLSSETIRFIVTE